MTVVVDAIDTAAARFYAHFGFLRLPNLPNRLFLPMKDIAPLFRKELGAKESLAPSAPRR